MVFSVEIIEYLRDSGPKSRTENHSDLVATNKWAGVCSRLLFNGGRDDDGERGVDCECSQNFRHQEYGRLLTKPRSLSMGDISVPQMAACLAALSDVS